jgi:hypothetical protein
MSSFTKGLKEILRGRQEPEASASKHAASAPQSRVVNSSTRSPGKLQRGSHQGELVPASAGPPDQTRLKREVARRQTDNSRYAKDPEPRYGPNRDQNRARNTISTSGGDPPDDPQDRFKYKRNRTPRAGDPPETSSGEEFEIEDDVKRRDATAGARAAMARRPGGKPPVPPRRPTTSQLVDSESSSNRNQASSEAQQHKSTSWFSSRSSKGDQKKSKTSSELQDPTRTSESQEPNPFSALEDDEWTISDDKIVAQSATRVPLEYEFEKEIYDVNAARTKLLSSNHGKMVTGALDDSHSHSGWARQRLGSMKRHFKDGQHWKDTSHSDTEDPFIFIADSIKRMERNVSTSKDGEVPRRPTKINEIDESIASLCQTIRSKESLKLSQSLKQSMVIAERNMQIPVELSPDPALHALLSKFLETMLFVEQCRMADAFGKVSIEPIRDGQVRAVFTNPQWGHMEKALRIWYKGVSTIRREQMDKTWIANEKEIRIQHRNDMEDQKTIHSEECQALNDKLTESYDAYDNDVKELEEEKSRLVQNHKKEIDRYETTVNRLDSDKQDLVQKIHDESNRLSEEHLVNITRIKAAHTRKLAEESEVRDGMSNEFKRQLALASSNHQSEINAKNAEMATAREAHRAAMDREDIEKTAFRRNAAEEKRNLTSKHEQAVLQLKTNFQADMEEAAGKYSDLKQEKDKMQALHVSEKQDMIAQHKKEVEDVKDAARRREAMIAKAHKTEIVALKEKVESIKSRATVRDHFKGLGDDEVVSKFADLYVEIEDLANADWSNSKKSSWLCPEAVLQRAENDRILRKDVLLNSFWQTLFKGYFSSPFAPLGDDGKRLEGEWMSEFGKGKHWFD